MKKFGIYEQRRGQRAILQNTFETEDEARLELERWIVHDLTSGKGSLAGELEGGGWNDWRQLEDGTIELVRYEQNKYGEFTDEIDETEELIGKRGSSNSFYHDGQSWFYKQL